MKLFFLIILIVACTKENQSVFNETQGTSSGENQIQGQQAPLTFPHDTAFRKNHGAVYQQNKKACQVCHGEDLKGGPSKVSCTSCHEEYPHDKQFRRRHSSAYLSKPKDCQKCHELERDVDLPAKKSCYKCHDFPHPKGWALPSKHGKAYLSQSHFVKCQGCHSSDGSSDAGKDKINCSSCHIAIPHASGFEEDHGEVASTYQGGCTNCHTNHSRNMPNMGEEGCITCHSGKTKVQWDETERVPQSLPSPKDDKPSVLKRYLQDFFKQVGPARW